MLVLVDVMNYSHGEICPEPCQDIIYAPEDGFQEPIVVSIALPLPAQGCIERECERASERENEGKKESIVEMLREAAYINRVAISLVWFCGRLFCSLIVMIVMIDDD